MDHIDQLLDEMASRKASDLYLTFGSPAALRVDESIVTMGPPLTDAMLDKYLAQLLTHDQRAQYTSTLEFNAALPWKNEARFRINVFRQQGHDGAVIRHIQTAIPTLDELHLPKLYGDLALLKRGLILIAGPTGSGKTTSLAAMIGHRNRFGSGHVLTVEDPIEFVHTHQRCIITQRDVGLDTQSYAVALKNALRQRPDLVVIGEVRDREVMEQAIYFAETGHLCIATLHANNSSQAIERVLNFFTEDRHQQILLNLAINLRAVLSQRLIPTLNSEHTLAIEIMLNNGLIRQLIQEGKIRQLREMIEKGTSEGMQSFDQCLFDLCSRKIISEETALAESDNVANLRMRITSARGLSQTITRDVGLKAARTTEAG